VTRAVHIFTGIEWIHANNIEQMTAFDERLNQANFAGLAAQNIASGEVSFLHGRSLWDGFLAIVPRLIWPNKPIFAGSSDLIREMTGIIVNPGTTFGVGQVMELYINFGIPSLVIGFLLFGFVFGWVDKRAAIALKAGDFAGLFPWFLCAIAMLQPLASIAEIAGNVVAALVAAYAWRYAWGMWLRNYAVPRLARQARGRVKQPDRKVTSAEAGRDSQ
jgi:hypothetical protein